MANSTGYYNASFYDSSSYYKGDIIDVQNVNFTLKEGGYNFKWQGNYTPDGTSKMLLKYKIKWYYEVYKFN